MRRSATDFATWIVFACAWVGLALSFDARADATIAGNDAVPYALALEDEDPARILDPHHPLFHVLAWAAMRGIGVLRPGLEMPGTWALKLVSSAGGALALALLFRAVARATSIRHGLLLAACFASTAGLRLFASVGETYWPALAAQLGLCLHLYTAEREGRPASLRVLIAWTVLALLLRQDALLAVPAATAALLLEKRRGELPQRLRDALLYLGASGALAICGYAATYGIYALQAAAPVGPIAWLTKLAQTGHWGAWGGLAPLYSSDPALPSAMRLSIELTIASWDYGLLSWLRGSPADGGALGVLRALAFALPLLLLLAPAFRRPGRTALCIALLFLLPRVVFYAWWQPGNTEYHAGHWIAVLPLLAIGIERWRTARFALAPLVAPACLATALVSSAVSNERALLAPLRAHTLHDRALQVGLWFAEGRRIASLDPLMSYALDRFGPIPRLELPPPELPREAVSAWARNEISKLGSGITDGIVFVRDTSLPRAFGTPPWSVEHLNPLVVALLASPHARGLLPPIFEPADGPREDAWALRFEPAH